MGRVESFQWKSYSSPTRPMCSLILAGKSLHPCSGARVLSHCAQLPKPVLSLLVLIPQPQYPSTHSVLPVFLAECLKYVSSSCPHCVCLPSGPCKLWPELIKHPVFMTSLLPFLILSNTGPRFFLTQCFPVSFTPRHTTSGQGPGANACSCWGLEVVSQIVLNVT